MGAPNPCSDPWVGTQPGLNICHPRSSALSTCTFLYRTLSVLWYEMRVAVARSALSLVTLMIRRRVMTQLLNTRGIPYCGTV